MNFIVFDPSFIQEEKLNNLVGCPVNRSKFRWLF